MTGLHEALISFTTTIATLGVAVVVVYLIARNALGPR